jgi:predicted NBD/HSP70 family sugar kinase
VKKNSTVATKRKKIFHEKELTIGLDLGDRFTYYCILDEAGEVVVERKMTTTKPRITQVFNPLP